MHIIEGSFEIETRIEFNWPPFKHLSNLHFDDTTRDTLLPTTVGVRPNILICRVEYYGTEHGPH
jgi:hypothetical protein